MSPGPARTRRAPAPSAAALRTVAAAPRPATCAACSTPDPPSARPARWAVMNAKPGHAALRVIAAVGLTCGAPRSGRCRGAYGAWKLSAIGVADVRWQGRNRPPGLVVAGRRVISAAQERRPRQDSNLRTRLRRPHPRTMLTCTNAPSCRSVGRAWGVEPDPAAGIIAPDELLEPDWRGRP
jgi:hypothetical protein